MGDKYKKAARIFLYSGLNELQNTCPTLTPLINTIHSIPINVYDEDVPERIIIYKGNIDETIYVNLQYAPNKVIAAYCVLRELAGYTVHKVAAYNKLTATKEEFVDGYKEALQLTFGAIILSSVGVKTKSVLKTIKSILTTPRIRSIARKDLGPVSTIAHQTKASKTRLINDAGNLFINAIRNRRFANILAVKKTIQNPFYVPVSRIIVNNRSTITSMIKNKKGLLSL